MRRVISWFIVNVYIDFKYICKIGRNNEKNRSIKRLYKICTLHV